MADQVGNQIGRQLGNYRLVRLLGQGHFAEVYLAEHLYLRTQVAIKLLTPRLTSEEVENFRAEARLVARLEHPHIVRILNFGIENSTAYLVMDYAQRGTLRQHHPQGTRVPLARIVGYVNQLAEALEYAHQQKVIHRDLKPENMLVGNNNEILLADFGIATIAQSSLHQETQEAAGTIAYMAPEQLQGKPRLGSDQYALGVVVYEWLCGFPPFRGSFTEIAAKHALNAPPPLHKRIPTITAEVEEVVLIALKKDPRERFASVRAFATAFKQACWSDPQFFVELQSEDTTGATKFPVQSGPTILPLSDALPISMTLQTNDAQSGPHPSVEKVPSPSFKVSNTPVLEVVPALRQNEPPVKKPSVGALGEFSRLLRGKSGRIAAGILSMLLALTVIFMLLPRLQVGSEHHTQQSNMTHTTTPPKVIYVISEIISNNTMTGSIISAINTSNGTTIWRYSGDHEEFIQAEVVNSVLYISSAHFNNTGSQDASTVYALRISDGMPVWDYRIYNTTRGGGSFYITGDLILVDAPPDGYDALYALRSRDGTLLWQYKMNMEDIALPQIVSNGVIYTSSYDFQKNTGNVYALQARNGAILWKYQMPPDVNASPTSVIVANGIVYATSPTPYNRFQYPYDPTKDLQNNNSTIYALRASDGAVLWTFESDNTSTFVKLEAINGILYASLASQKNSTNLVYALKAKSGVLLWKYQAYLDNKYGLYNTATIVDGIVYFASLQTNNKLYALNGNNGAILWSYNDASSDLIGGNGVIYSPSGSASQRYVSALRESNGALLWNYPMPNGFYTSSIVFKGGSTLYVGSSNFNGLGNVVALNVSNGSLIWQSQIASIRLIVA